jgi:hypothetical protein
MVTDKDNLPVFTVPFDVNCSGTSWNDMIYKQDNWESLGTYCNYPSKNALIYCASTIQTKVYGFRVHIHVYKREFFIFLY